MPFWRFDRKKGVKMMEKKEQTKKTSLFFQLCVASPAMPLQMDAPTHAKDEPPRGARAKLVMVLARFCRIAPIEHISFVPESKRWKRFFDGKRGINDATSSVCTVICFPDPANQLSTTLANPNTSKATVVT